MSERGRRRRAERETERELGEEQKLGSSKRKKRKQKKLSSTFSSRSNFFSFSSLSTPTKGQLSLLSLSLFESGRARLFSSLLHRPVTRIPSSLSTQPLAFVVTLRCAQQVKREETSEGTTPGRTHSPNSFFSSIYRSQLLFLPPPFSPPLFLSPNPYYQPRAPVHRGRRRIVALESAAAAA